MLKSKKETKSYWSNLSAQDRFLLVQLLPLRMAETNRQLAFLFSVLPRKQFNSRFSFFKGSLNSFADDFRRDIKPTTGVRAVVPLYVEKFAVKFDKWEATIRANYIDRVLGSKG